MKELTQFINSLSPGAVIALCIMLTAFIISWIILIGQLMHAKELDRETKLQEQLFDLQKREFDRARHSEGAARRISNKEVHNG